MEKWLVKLSKNPRQNLLVIIGLFLIYEVNRKYVGLDFSSDALERIFNIYPFLLIGLLCLNTSISGKNKKLVFSQVLIIFLLVIFHLTVFLFQARQDVIQKIELGSEIAVKEIRFGEQSYLMSEIQWTPFFIKKNCVYSFMSGTGGQLTALTMQSLNFEWNFKGVSEDIIIEIKKRPFLKDVYSCQVPGENIDPYSFVFTFWINLFSLPFEAQQYNPNR